MRTDIYVRYTDLTEVPEPAINGLLDRLPPAQKTQLLRYHQPIDRLRGAAGKLMLQAILQEQGYDAGVLDRLRADAYHRPFLDDSIDFNITHSGNIVALALSRNGRIGIDVEEIHDLDLHDYESFFNDKELHSMRSHEFPMQRFFELWTKKEAVMKANGKGMHLPVHDIKLEGERAICEGVEWQLQSLSIRPGYACHLAAAWAATPDVREYFL